MAQLVSRDGFVHDRTSFWAEVEGNRHPINNERVTAGVDNTAYGDSIPYRKDFLGRTLQNQITMRSQWGIMTSDKQP